MNERRRSPRVTVEDAELTMGPFVTGVKVLDIGAGGVLLESGRRPQVGERGRLSLTLAGAAVAAQVEVQRVSPGNDPPPGRFHVAARFVSLRPEHRQIIAVCTAV
jgi:PilZ domain